MLGVVLVTVLSVVDADEDMESLACFELVWPLCREKIKSLFVRRRKQLQDVRFQCSDVKLKWTV